MKLFYVGRKEMVNFELADGRYTGLCVMFENGNGYEETYRDMMLNRDQLDKILDQVVKTAEDLNVTELYPLDLHDGMPHSIVELENKCNDMVRLRLYEMRKSSYDNTIKNFREGLEDARTMRAFKEVLGIQSAPSGLLKRFESDDERKRIEEEKAQIRNYLVKMGPEATEDFRSEFNGSTGGRFKEPFEKEYADALKSEIKVGDMVKALYLRETFEDVRFFKQYKQGEVKIDVSGKDTMEIIKRHGSTSTSKYESAVLIMEALKRDKEQGKDILPAMKLLNEEMAKKTLPRPQPDGVRQFMFDELMKIENNELNKFSTGRKVWGDVLGRLIGKNLERYKEFNEFYDRVLLDKVDVSKQKKDVKARLADRIKQLSRGEDAVSGVVVVDEVEKDTKQQREIGLSVSDKDKFVAFHRDRLNKEGISQPLRKQMIERFGKGK